MNILEEALALIHGDREKTHGDPGRNLRDIAGKWSVTLGVPVTPEQVALCMIDLKTVRAKHDSAHRDHWVDIAGYAGLVDRCGFVGKQSGFISKAEMQGEDEQVRTTNPGYSFGLILTGNETMLDLERIAYSLFTALKKVGVKALQRTVLKYSADFYGLHVRLKATPPIELKTDRDIDAAEAAFSHVMRRLDRKYKELDAYPRLTLTTLKSEPPGAE